ncbi:MAG: hypothetical protein ACRCXM_10470 [Beijerinckiaceae bacterium]
MRALIRSFLADRSGTLLATTIKGAVMVGVFSVASGWYLNHRLEGERRALATMSATASGKVDMSTTGSIKRDGNYFRLEPCVVQKN